MVTCQCEAGTLPTCTQATQRTETCQACARADRLFAFPTKYQQAATCPCTRKASHTVLCTQIRMYQSPCGRFRSSVQS